MTSLLETNKTIIRRYYHELWNQWDFRLAEQVISEDIRFRGSLGLQANGRAEFIGYMETVRAAFPDFHNHIEELVAEGNKVVARLTYSGTHEGVLFGKQATHRKVSYAGVAIFEILDGQIVQGWVLGDTFGLMKQIDANIS